MDDKWGRNFCQRVLVCFCTLLPGVLIVGGCSSQSRQVSSLREAPKAFPVAKDRSWVVAPPLKGDEHGDWYYLRARVSSHDILFYQLCLRDRRDGDEGWAFYEQAFDNDNREYPTVVLSRKVSQESVMKELLGIMLTREELEKASRNGLVLHVEGKFATMHARIQAAYARGFLLLVDEYMEEHS